MKILMVCLGNICRSPLADGIMRKLVQDYNLDWTIDSAGTGNWHVGETPDRRAIQTAKKFGVDISGLCARQFSVKDFDEFDKIYVMDASNYQDVIALARNEEDKKKVDLLLNLTHPKMNKTVPDPWYDETLFEPVFKMIEEACKKIVAGVSNSRQ
jgi:protein-tyrosine phosphatase